MNSALLNLSMVKVSILIMFIMCIVLMGLVFTLAISLWRLRDKLKSTLR